MLTVEGTVLVKFWMHISSGEQLKRFEARANDPLKSWKLSPEDWRNRGQRELYEQALEEMFERTDAKHARWHIVAAESKHYARVQRARNRQRRDRAGSTPPDSKNPRVIGPGPISTIQ